MIEENMPGNCSREEMEALLWEYIDGFVEPAQQRLIEQLVAEHVAWKQAYTELLEMHRSLQASELEQPSMRFTKNVMEQIAQLHIAPAAKEYINKKVVWSLAAFFVSVVLGFLIYGFSQVQWKTSSWGNLPTIDFGRVDYSPMFNNAFVNYFMMLNVILALFLLDRFLTMKKKQLLEKDGLQ